MIFIYTGAPGAGKTMCLVAHAVARGETENRPVYQSGIPGLEAAGVRELPDPLDWMSVPDNSIVVVDEAQRVWGMRLAKEPIPDSIRAMETHRHRGIDIYCATQSINMLDVHLRRLCGVHRHLVRVFGLRASTVYEFDEACDDTRDRRARQQSRRSRFKFSRKYYSRYRSMTMDTAQSRLPWFIKWGVPVLVVGFALVLWFLHGELAGAREHFGAHALAKPVAGHQLPAGYHFVHVAARRHHQAARRVSRRWRVRGVVRSPGRVVWILQGRRDGDVVEIGGARCRGRVLADVRCPAPGGGWARSF